VSDTEDHPDEGGDPACWAHLAGDDTATTIDLGPLLRELERAGGDGVHWTLEGPSELNANLARLDPGHEMPEHVNDAVDVLLVVLAGRGLLRVGTRAVPLAPPALAHLPKGERRAVQAGPEGLAYLTVHRRRPGPEITPRNR